MSTRDSWIGVQIGPYRLRERLGSGGSGTVYAAWDGRLEREVALKVVVPAPGAPSGAAARFRREAVLAARLSHPGIVPIYDVGEAEEPLPVVYLAMRRLPGRTLADLLAEGGPLPAREAIRLAAALADALDYAHRQGVLHRDLKPANVLLDEEGRPLLADFGIARALEEAHGGGPGALTLTGTTVGTPAYMSPEQAAGRPLDARSDLYSLGVLLYEMLVGHPPFRGSPPQVMRAHLERPPAPPSQLRPDLPPALDQIVLKALAKDPAGRFSSGAALAEALRRAMPEAEPTRLIPTLAAPAPAAAAAGTPVRWVLLGALGTLLLIGAAVSGMILGRQGVLLPAAQAPSTAGPSPAVVETISSTVTTSATGTPAATETPPTATTIALPSATAPVVAVEPSPPPAASATQPPPANPTASPTAAPSPSPTATSALASCEIAVDPAFEGLWTPGAGCPLAAPFAIEGAIEQFEGGTMFWRKDQDRIYVLFEGSSTWATYSDPWTESDPEFACEEALSAGNPKRGFGNVWCRHETVRSQLGPALEEERPVAFRIQATDGGDLLVKVENEPRRYLLFESGVYLGG